MAALLIDVMAAVAARRSRRRAGTRRLSHGSV